MFLFLNPKFHILRNNNFSLLTSTRNNIKKNIHSPQTYLSLLPSYIRTIQRKKSNKKIRISPLEGRRGRRNSSVAQRGVGPARPRPRRRRRRPKQPPPPLPSLPQSRNKAERDSSPIGTRGRKRANKRTKRKIGVLQRCKGDECRRRSRRCQACRASSP